MHARDLDVARRKQELRRRMRAARRQLAPHIRAAASRAIAQHLGALPELQGAGRVVGYAAMDGEVDLDGWLRDLLAAGITLLLPRVEGDDLRLGHVRDLDSDLEPGWMGLREPRQAAGEDPASVDAAVVPGLAFDGAGWRLGQGGGHIDRLLARLRPDAIVVGAAFSVQLLAEGIIPLARHDVPVDVIVTDTGIWRSGRSARSRML